MRILRPDIIMPLATGDCTHFVLHNLGILTSPGEVPGEILDRFVGGLEIVTRQNQPTIVLYNRRPYARHWGFAIGKRVISKWGLGPILEHDIDDINPMWNSPFGHVQYWLPEQYHPRINALFSNSSETYSEK